MKECSGMTAVQQPWMQVHIGARRSKVTGEKSGMGGRGRGNGLVCCAWLLGEFFLSCLTGMLQPLEKR